MWAFCHLLGRPWCYTYHRHSAALWSECGLVEPALVDRRDNVHHSCSTLPNEAHLMKNTWYSKTQCPECGEAARKPNPICKSRGRIRCSDTLVLFSVGPSRWRSGSNTSAVTSTCWLNTASYAVVQQIWLTVGGSYTNTHADRYLPPAQHGGDQLAGNEAEKHWRICVALWKHTANSRTHIQAATLPCAPLLIKKHRSCAAPFEGKHQH